MYDVTGLCARAGLADEGPSAILGVVSVSVIGIPNSEPTPEPSHHPRRACLSKPKSTPPVLRGQSIRSESSLAADLFTASRSPLATPCAPLLRPDLRSRQGASSSSLPANVATLRLEAVVAQTVLQPTRTTRTPATQSRVSFLATLTGDYTGDRPSQDSLRAPRAATPSPDASHRRVCVPVGSRSPGWPPTAALTANLLQIRTERMSSEGTWSA